jgi:type II secretory pathway pseudopilin PulG
MTPLVTPQHRRLRPGRRGLSLSEVMISLAITTMLLTAIAAAFHSSSQIITENDEFFRATQAARVALNQMLTEVRRADEVVAEDTIVPGTPAFTVSKISSNLLPVSRPLAAHMSQEYMRYYSYDPASKKLLLYFQDPTGKLSSPYPLASNVQQSPFAWDEAKSSDNRQIASRVAISLEVAVGNNRIRLSGSAVPRRSMKVE